MRAWSLVVSPLTRQVLVLVVVLRFCLKTKQGVYPHVLLHRWRSVKIMCHTGAGVDMEPAVDFCIPMFVGQQNITEGGQSQKTGYHHPTSTKMVPWCIAHGRENSLWITLSGTISYKAWLRGFTSHTLLSSLIIKRSKTIGRQQASNIATPLRSKSKQRCGTIGIR